MSRYLSFVADLTKESFGCSNNGASRTDITFVTFTTFSSLASRSLRFTRLSFEKISSLLRATTKNSEEENLSFICSYSSKLTSSSSTSVSDEASKRNLSTQEKRLMLNANINKRVLFLLLRMN